MFPIANSLENVLPYLLNDLRIYDSVRIKMVRNIKLNGKYLRKPLFAMRDQQIVDFASKQNLDIIGFLNQVILLSKKKNLN